jgi:hypothetical protein
VLVLLCLAALCAGAGRTQANAHRFFVGFSEDLPKKIGPAAAKPAERLGASAFRVTLMWAPGERRVSTRDARQLARAVRGTKGMRLVLAVYAFPGTRRAPLDPGGRDQYCAYTADALRRFPTIRDVVIWNEPNKSLFWSPQLTDDQWDAAPLAYEALLARCWDVLHAARRDVNVIGFALSSTGRDDATSHSPGNFIRLVGDAFRESGRTRPLFDTVGHHPYGRDARERPWHRHVGSTTIALGDWNKLMSNLREAFRGSAQPIPGEKGVSIWYMEYGVETRVDPARRRSYRAREHARVLPDVALEADVTEPAGTSRAPDQSTQVLDAIRLAACQPYVGAIFNFLLVDEPRLTGWQSGVYYADRTPKRSYPAFQEAIAEASGGRVDCDGLKGGRPSADFTPPEPPADVSLVLRPAEVELTWTDVPDAVSYEVYRDGTCLGSTRAELWIGERPRATSLFAVRPVDAAGNLGEPTVPLVVDGRRRAP